MFFFIFSSHFFKPRLNKKSLSRTGKVRRLYQSFNQVHTSLPREFYERSAEAVDLAYQFPGLELNHSCGSASDSNRLRLSAFPFGIIRHPCYIYLLSCCNYQDRSDFNLKTTICQIKNIRNIFIPSISVS